MTHEQLQEFLQRMAKDCETFVKQLHQREENKKITEAFRKERNNENRS